MACLTEILSQIAEPASSSPTTPLPPICNICLEPFASSSPPPRDHPSPFHITDLAPITIATEAADPEPAIALKQCGHVFGSHCLATWFQTANTCPMCRTEVFQKPEPVEPNVHFSLGAYVFGGIEVGRSEFRDGVRIGMVGTADERLEGDVEDFYYLEERLDGGEEEGGWMRPLLRRGEGEDEIFD
ncbi:hypothetical protein P154DRAFT_578136 [Amniculicola lignicola CBS 123094]|uniref:RING-type domain-containing protein n=1 Tax=Amniculicola lignicola CBS 123094 TaxID=1392246 RepID=A0A6A5WAA2_9PLEO|nr:hypothetical protein P154DRAFT_578136 [Amniculicola lignicola CBS 123094]